MNCKFEAWRIAKEIKGYAQRNPRVSHCMKAEVNEMLNFLGWVDATLGDAGVRDGSALFKLYRMRLGGASGNRN